ncbi:hypothetical protein GCM10009585_12560 [Brevibacterium paucivorans]
MNRYRAGAVAWLASAVLFPVQLLVALRWPQGYSVRDNAISDLGVTVCGGFSEQGQQVREVCSPWHQLFNAGMVVSGVLIVIGALLLHGWWDSRSGRTGTSVIALTGLSVSIVGLAPWDTHPGVHDFAALGQAVTQWLAMGLLAVAAERGHFRRLTIVALVVSLVGFAAFLAALEGVEVPWVGFGGAERLSFDTLSLWTALVGATLLRRRGHRGQATGPAKSPTIRTR